MEVSTEAVPRTGAGANREEGVIPREGDPNTQDRERGRCSCSGYSGAGTPKLMGCSWWVMRGGCWGLWCSREGLWDELVGGICGAVDQSYCSCRNGTPMSRQHAESVMGEYSSSSCFWGVSSAWARDEAYYSVNSLSSSTEARGGDCHICAFKLVTLILVFVELEGLFTECMDTVLSCPSELSGGKTEFVAHVC